MRLFFAFSLLLCAFCAPLRAATTFVPVSITLTAPASFPTETINKLILGRLIDDPGNHIAIKEVSLYPAGRVYRITLWTGSAYDAAGQYTDADIQARLQALAALPYTDTTSLLAQIRAQRRQ